MKKTTLTIFWFAIIFYSYSQSFCTGTDMQHSRSILEAQSSNKTILFPSINLTTINGATTILNPTTKEVLSSFLWDTPNLSSYLTCCFECNIPYSDVKITAVHF